MVVAGLIKDNLEEVTDLEREEGAGTKDHLVVDGQIKDHQEVGGQIKDHQEVGGQIKGQVKVMELEADLAGHQGNNLDTTVLLAGHQVEIKDMEEAEEAEVLVGLKKAQELAMVLAGRIKVLRMEEIKDLQQAAGTNLQVLDKADGVKVEIQEGGQVDLHLDHL